MTVTRPALESPPDRERSWFGHPRGLTILFLTEMWSEFSFFGMRTLLVYYMTQQLLIPQARSSLIYGLYVAFAYFTPLLAGPSRTAGSVAAVPCSWVEGSWRQATS